MCFNIVVWKPWTNDAKSQPISVYVKLTVNDFILCGFCDSLFENKSNEWIVISDYTKHDLELSRVRETPKMNVDSSNFPVRCMNAEWIKKWIKIEMGRNTWTLVTAATNCEGVVSGSKSRHESIFLLIKIKIDSSSRFQCDADLRVEIYFENFSSCVSNWALERWQKIDISHMKRTHATCDFSRWMNLLWATAKIYSIIIWSRA